MRRFLYLLFCFLSFHLFAHSDRPEITKTHYPLAHDPIDVVIVAHAKDKEILAHCIQGAKKNIVGIRRLIVVSAERLSHHAEWFNEANGYPFSKEDILLALGRGDRQKGEQFFKKYHYRPVGWYYQQLLKLYAPLVIPDISSNVLCIDADTVFLNPTQFLNEQHGGLFCTSPLHPKPRYLRFAAQLNPTYRPIHTEVYSVCHHMLFQRPILQHLMEVVEEHHKKEFWRAFCEAVDIQRLRRVASEYELYYNFALNHTDQVALRSLNWTNSGQPLLKNKFRKLGYHFVSFHDYMVKKQ